jgi:hypothetical protein
MNATTKNLMIMLAFGAIILACEGPQKAVNSDTEMQSADPGTKTAIAEEVIDATTYNYVKMKEGNKRYWIAISSQPVEVGRTYYFEPEGLMLDFESKNLNKTFDSVYFVSKFSSQPLDVHGMVHGDTPSGSIKTNEQTNISVEPAENGQTIAQIYDNTDDYRGKKVRVRGVVIKFTPGIMNTNWVHIQDGTKSSSGNFDLTVTTDETLTVGTVVVLEGTLVTDKDFGYGYKYDVLVENAVHIDKKTAI